MMNRQLMRFSIVLSVFLLFFLVGHSIAQTAVEIDSITESEISADNPQVIFSLEASAGDSISIQAIALSESLALQAVVFGSSNNLVLALGNPDNTERITGTLAVPSDDTYTIQVTSSNGQTGAFILRLSSVSDEEICETFIEESLFAIQEVCDATGRNQACLANLSASAEPVSNLSEDFPFRFEQVGDIVDIATVQSFSLSPLNISNEEWGLAYLQVQANLPDTLPGQNVTVLLFGDVQVVNTAITEPSLLAEYRPMQAFYFTTGIGQARCAAVPDSGILIQTPNNADLELSFSINNVDIQLGSTAFLSFNDEQELNIDLLEGTALVSSQNESQILLSGQRLQVPVDEDFFAAGVPSEPETIPEDVPRLPLPIQEENTNPTSASPIATSSSSTRPDLPTEGACVLRSFEDDGRPNVRSRPATDASIASYILPTELYPVIGRTAESDWFQISTGWIAAFVTERGGDCSRVPPTPTPMPTSTPTPTATLELPIAGNNEFSIRIDAAMRGTQHILNGAISHPQGDNRDTVSYTVFNLEHGSSNNSLQYSITCTGTGVEYAIMIFSDGSTYDCSPTASNFLDMGFNQTSDSITVAFSSGVEAAYVNWQMSFSVVAR